MALTQSKKFARRTDSRRANPAAAEKSARERIVESAGKLFYQQGSRAVGIDTVIAESGVAKMSLYRNFKSKDELIGAWLADVNEGYWERFDRSIEPFAGKPREQLRAVFRGLAERSSKPGYRGCPFLNTALDYSESQHPGRKVSVRHKKTLANKLLHICKQLGVRHPQSLSRQLVLLVNGAQATAGMLGAETQRELMEAAETLIGAQLTKSSRK
jgi:AcrR family transcriptional regulator